MGYAVLYDKIEIVRYLISKEVDLDAVDVRGNSALNDAIRLDRFEIGTLLIGSNAAVSEADRAALLLKGPQWSNLISRGSE